MTVRYSYFDFARALLMVLGVFYHAAEMFQLEIDATVYFDTRDSLFDSITFVIHLFRMPAFFLVAGFFGALTLNKYQPIEFLQRRANRLLVPFAIFAAFVNTWIFHRISNEPMTGSHYPALHLWFLPVLMICAVLHSVLFRPDQLGRVLPVLRIPHRLVAPLILLGGAAMWFVAMHVMWRLPLTEMQNLTDGFVDFDEFGQFLPMYFLGAVLYHYRSHLETLFAAWPLHLVATLTYFGLRTAQPDSHLTEFFQYVAGIGMTLLTLSFCRHATATISRQWMSNYSYTLYLFHMPILIALRLPVMTHVEGILPRYLLICGVTIAICSALHLIIVRSALLSYLLNGESKIARKRSAEAIPGN